MSVLPYCHTSTSFIDPYNCLLSLSQLTDNANITTILDNYAVYYLCKKQLWKKLPNYNTMNLFMSSLISSTTYFNSDLNTFQSSIVPFPRLHFLFGSMSPILKSTAPPGHGNHSYGTQAITESCFSAYCNDFIQIADFDSDEDKYLGYYVLYRGDVTQKEANRAMSWMKDNKKIIPIEWIPNTTFVTKTTKSIPPILHDQDFIFKKMKRNIYTLCNNVAIRRVFQERICKKYDKMYSQRAFIHWFINEGMEEIEFDEARENLGVLENDYIDFCSKDITDEDNDYSE